MTEVILLTTNSKKQFVAESIFKKFDITLKTASDHNIPEIQADSSLEVAKASVSEYFRIHQKPVIKEDHSLYLDGIKFPGPYSRYAQENISVDHLAKIAKSLDINGGFFELGAAFIDQFGEIHTATTQAKFKFNFDHQETPMPGWQSVVKHLDENGKEYTDNDKETTISIWGKNFKLFAEILKSQF